MSERARAPLIGITCEAVRPGRDRDYIRYHLLSDHRYAQAVENSGGHPVLLPIARDTGVRRRYLEGIDGLVIVGGEDVDPRLYGQRPLRTTKLIYPGRTGFETWLYRAGKRRGLPIFGICHGMQLINVLEGGTLRQHIRQRSGQARVVHRGRGKIEHKVRVFSGTRLQEILRVSHASVSTEHHQAVAAIAPGFIPAAVAEDGVIEALEHPGSSELLAVQWHPERKPESLITRRLFDAFVRACARYRDER